MDTSGLLALLDRKEPDHQAVRAVVDDHSGPFVVSHMVLAELDYLVVTRHGVDAELTMLDVVTDGAWTIESLKPDELAAAVEVVKKYRDVNVGLTDATNVILAHRFRIDTILTLDHRHFDVLRQLNGQPFDVLPHWPT